MLKQRQPSPADDALNAKYMDVARRLEEELFKLANSKEDYMNRSTLESRITSIIKGRQLNNYNQEHANSSSLGTMIPSSGLSHDGGNPNLMVTSSADAGFGLGSSRNTVGPMSHDLLQLREYMRTLVFNELQKRNPSPTDDALKAKYLDVARRLEEELFKMAASKEDYLNPSTLNSRLTSIIKHRRSNNYNQNQRNDNSSSVGTMITMDNEKIIRRSN